MKRTPNWTCDIIKPYIRQASALKSRRAAATEYTRSGYLIYVKQVMWGRGQLYEPEFNRMSLMSNKHSITRMSTARSGSGATI